MQTAITSPYSANRRAPPPVDLEHAPSRLNVATPALDDVEYLLEFDATTALPTGYTQISDVPVRYRSASRITPSHTQCPRLLHRRSHISRHRHQNTSTRAHVFFRMPSDSIPTADPNTHYSNSSVWIAQVSANASTVMAFALHPSSFAPSNTTLDNACDFFGQIIPKNGVTTQQTSVYSRKRHTAEPC